jgi:sortase (surface protein transpeptidase)
MLNNILEISKSSATRHYARVMAFAVLGIAVVVILVYFFPTKPLVYAPEVQTENVEQQATTSVFARSIPVRLHIPKIQLDTTFVAPLGLNADKSVSVPDSYTEVGWYKYGATPGEIGPAVILGHVDSYQGAAIFYHLGGLETGDEIEITREDGTVVTFVVTDMERKLQSEFPTEKVYGPIPYAGLRLITCTGTYNHGTLRYSHNLIVYAELKSTP